ncbi:hypothetical protein P9747_21760, partial [Paenibacillus macerans]|nr:hypothetical protein [Paenibacillus macerans]
QKLQQQLQEARAQQDKLRAEIAAAVQNEKSWQKLADKRGDELSRLEISLLEAEGRGEQLEEQLRSSAADLASVRERLQAEEENARVLADELDLLRRQLEEASRERETALLTASSAEEEKQRMAAELSRLHDRLQDMNAELQEHAEREERLAQLREAAEKREQELMEQWASAEGELEALRGKEAELLRQLDEWQQESAAGSERVIQLSGDYQQLEEEKQRLAEELRQISEHYEIISHEYRLLKVEREAERETFERREEEHRRLQEDYAKLQTEFNEWIELIEQDQS